MEPILVTGNAKLDHYLTIIGIVTTLSSMAATFLNAKMRAVVDAGETIPKPFMYVALAANYAALNIDKCAQLHRMLDGKPMTVMVAKKDEGTNA